MKSQLTCILQLSIFSNWDPSILGTEPTTSIRCLPISLSATFFPSCKKHSRDLSYTEKLFLQRPFSLKTYFIHHRNSFSTACFFMHATTKQLFIGQFLGWIQSFEASSCNRRKILKERIIKATKKQANLPEHHWHIQSSVQAFQLIYQSIWKYINYSIFTGNVALNLYRIKPLINYDNHLRF